MDKKAHWETVYQNKAVDSVSWFQPHAETSLRLIQSLQPDTSSSIIDVGGGASTLVDDLLQNGYSDISVLDISAAALEFAKERIGERASDINWIVNDVTQLDLLRNSIDVWHDRAVFHFLTNETDRQRYVDSVIKAVKPCGHVIISTFSEDGPTECSGLTVQRYNEASLHDEFGSPFTLLGHENEVHYTPNGKNQSFVYCYCRVKQH